MNIKEVKDLLQEILRSDIAEFELEHTGTRIRLRRGSVQDVAVAPSTPVAPPPVLSAFPHPAPGHAPEVGPPREPPKVPEQEDEESGLHFITSPIVGTFYRSPKPGAEPFVKPGQLVDEGAILCIVEAMKLMNEIPSDVAGEIVRVYAEDARPVEFGQRLFGLRPRR